MSFNLELIAKFFVGFDFFKPNQSLGVLRKYCFVGILHICSDSKFIFLENEILASWKLKGKILNIGISGKITNQECCISKILSHKTRIFVPFAYYKGAQA